MEKGRPMLDMGGTTGHEGPRVDQKGKGENSRVLFLIFHRLNTCFPAIMAWMAWNPESKETLSS